MAEDKSPHFWGVQPVLVVRDLQKSLLCWRDLGFSVAWVWGEPPQTAQVSRDSVGVLLEHNPGLAAHTEGTSISISVRNIETLYKQHQDGLRQSQNAQIITPLGITPMGSREYTVREINGCLLRFSAPPAPVFRAKTLPPSVQIVERAPTVDEYLFLTNSVGWQGISREDAARRIDEACCCLIAQQKDNDTAVGSLFVVPVGTRDFYIKDVMVHPNWQGQRIGAALIQKMLKWVHQNAANTAQISLHTDESIAPFYASLGFTTHFGMSQRIKR